MHLFEKMEEWASERDRKAVRQALKAARYAAINWKFDTKELILQVEKSYEPPLYHRRVVTETSATHLQINAFSDRIFPSLNKNQSFDQESPAALVYSLHPNGQIAVMAIPHNSSHHKLERSTFILDIVPFNGLTGVRGRNMVRRHLRALTRLCYISMTEYAPSGKDQKFIEVLERQNDKYVNLFANRQERRKHSELQDINLGIGLAAGLMASTIFPLLPAIGTWATEKLKCTGSSQCATGIELWVTQGLSKLDAPLTLTLAAFLAGYVAWRVRTYLKQR